MPGNDGRKGWVVDMTGWSEKSCSNKIYQILDEKAGKNGIFLDGPYIWERSAF